MLIATFHENAIDYNSKLKIQLIFSEISTNHNMALPKFLYFEIFQMVLEICQMTIRTLSCFDNFLENSFGKFLANL